ncbi:aldo/keto reductase [candidate division KSB3 bacterium]|uniref:Aldo/keto reductase n=1 Tax=candidate division KSB3 bacterium TaxID=2044937 RepID=A0A2G6E913_9BACT|nr:MAG: aldo/keto reductase [candidate division KSB3 bacterium]PIE29527.1 MAG: aldo/keto reductase [candidate division KSB3 bacterium]
MQYRNYGNSGTEVSALGFGGMRFEDPNDHEKSVATVLHAFDKGITYFDTAPSYCHEQSEIIMGKAILEMKKLGRPFWISTKSNKKTGAELRRDLEKSLMRLNVDVIDFYNCWYVLSTEDWALRKSGGAVQEILKAKEEGLIRHAVFSTHLPGADIRKVIEEGYFEGVTLGYSAINFPYRQDGVNAAAERGMGVVVMNPLGGGTIVSNEEAFNFIKVHERQSILEAALHFLLAQQEISVSLLGFRNSADVDSAVAALENYRPYRPEEFEHMRRRVQGEFNDLCTSCMYCKGCPEDIPVWMLMETCNHLLLKGGDNILNRLKNHWGTDISELERCTECRQCEAACTQHLPILERFKMLKDAVAQLVS